MSTFLAKKLLAGVVATGLSAAAATANPGGAVVKPAYGHAGYGPAGHHTGGQVVHGGGQVVHAGGSYHLTHGRAFAGGYCYPGRNHTHWTYSGYSAKYRCTCYWCPSTCQYYYWCQSADCYYPVSYIASAPPTYVPAPYVPPTYAPPVQVQVPAPPCCPAPVPYPAPAPYPGAGSCPMPGPSPYPAGGPAGYQTQTQTQTQTQVQGPPAGVPPLPQ